MELLKKTPRIEVVDALRGFAVMAILWYIIWNISFSCLSESSPEWLSILDAGVFNAVFSLFAGKSYAIFALLFGFTFYIQSHNQQLKGKDFGYRFYGDWFYLPVLPLLTRLSFRLEMFCFCLLLSVSYYLLYANGAIRLF